MMKVSARKLSAPLLLIQSILYIEIFNLGKHFESLRYFESLPYKTLIKLVLQIVRKYKINYEKLFIILAENFLWNFPCLKSHKCCNGLEALNSNLTNSNRSWFNLKEYKKKLDNAFE